MSKIALNKTLLFLILPSITQVVLFCSKDQYAVDSGNVMLASCEGCGGEAPHYEPYDRVYMGEDGFELSTVCANRHFKNREKLQIPTD